MARPMHDLLLSIRDLTQQHRGGRVRGPAVPMADHDALFKCAEYLGLRSEMIDWQNRRWLTVGFTMSIFIFVVSQTFGTNSFLRDHADLLAPLVSLYLSMVWCFIVYARKSNVGLGAYIQVFLEDQETGRGMRYETRLHERSKQAKLSGIDWFILALFAFVLLGSIGAAWWSTSRVNIWWTAGAIALFALTAFLSVKRWAISREQAIEDWLKVLRHEVTALNNADAQAREAA